MPISFSTARNLGLTILLVIIIIESVFSFAILAKNATRLTQIITVDNVKLQRWHDVTEIISAAKDKLYSFRMGNTELVAPVDLLINRAMTEMTSIREIATDEEERNSVDAILNASRFFRQALFAYEKEMRKGSLMAPSAREVETVVFNAADQITFLGRGAAEFVSKRIEDNHKAILEITSFSQKMLAFVLFLAIIATVVASLFMAKALARPIENLVTATQRLASGDLSCQVVVDSNDSIGQLAKSFNRMAAELKKSNHKLLAAKAFTDSIIRSMTNTLIVVNPDGTIRAANQSTYDLLGYTQEELIGQPFSMVFSKGYSSIIELDSLISTGKARNIETVFNAKNGEKIRVLFSGSAFFNDEGEYKGIVCVAHDITMQSEAMRAGHLASIGELAAGVAHEINNPINSIINFSQILLDELEHGETPSTDIPKIIIKESDRVAAIVRSLLSFARESIKDKDTVNLSRVLDEVMELTRAQMEKDGINLQIGLPDNLPPIEGNFQQLEQVVLNIINNARYALNKKYPGSHPEKKLQIMACQGEIKERPAVQLTFHDQGIGIPAAIIDKISNPFFSTKPPGLGTGLGLAISHGIISDHGGTLNFESDEGEYTTVTIMLPNASATENKTGPDESPPHAKG